MDREVVFAVLVIALCGGALMAGGWWPVGSFPADHFSERRMWWRIWFPFAPALFMFALLCGWLLAEPRSAEPVPALLMLAALPFALIFCRAAWRAAHALAIPYELLTIATVGLLRPRIVVAPQFPDSLDKNALAAAMEHERAHARHRDPLRLWLAQFGTELLWPAPAALRRLQLWKRSLEVARDDEARARGIAGPDLAAAIVVSLRFNQTVAPASTANLAEEGFLRERVMRLLQPLEQKTSAQRRIGPIFLILSLAIALAVLLGVRFGEMLIGSLLIRA